MVETKKVMGIGIYEPLEYRSRINGRHTDVYDTWQAMLQRCYDEKLHKRHPSYKECTVIEEWLNFQTFAKWFNKHYISGYQLDKDLLQKGNKTYSPETSCFIPQEINLALIKPFVKRKLPLGVYKHHYTPNKYVTHIKVNKVSKYLGIFNNIEDATDCYIKAKKQQLKDLANKYKETLIPEAYNALINYNITTND